MKICWDSSAVLLWSNDNVHSIPEQMGVALRVISLFNHSFSSQKLITYYLLLITYYFILQRRSMRFPVHTEAECNVSVCRQTWRWW